MQKQILVTASKHTQNTSEHELTHKVPSRTHLFVLTDWLNINQLTNFNCHTNKSLNGSTEDACKGIMQRNVSFLNQP